MKVKILKLSEGDGFFRQKENFEGKEMNLIELDGGCGMFSFVNERDSQNAYISHDFVFVFVLHDGLYEVLDSKKSKDEK